MVPENDKGSAEKKDKGSEDSSNGGGPPPPEHDPEMLARCTLAEEEKELAELVETQLEEENSDAG